MKSKSKTCGEEKHNQNLKSASAIDFVLVLYLKLEVHKDEGYKDGGREAGRRRGSSNWYKVDGGCRRRGAAFLGGLCRTSTPCYCVIMSRRKQGAFNVTLADQNLPT